jgi:hypothetical protein
VRRVWDNNGGTSWRIETLAVMSNFQSLLRHIPEPSVRLFLGLAVFATVAVVILAILDGSGHASVMHQIRVD